MQFADVDSKIADLEKAVASIRKVEHQKDLVRRATPAIHHMVENAAKSLAESLIAQMGHRLSPGDGSTVYVVHYTGIDTVIDILKSARHPGYLRMYSSSGFNDPDEGRYLYSAGVSQATAELAGLRESEGFAYVASFITHDADDPGKLRSPEHAYRAADKLPFWREYANEGNGVAITATVQPQRLYRVKYGPCEAKTTAGCIAKYRQRILNVVKELHSDNMEQGVKDIIGKQLQLISYLYKSQAYGYEEESRVVKIPDGQDPLATKRTDFKNGQFRVYYEDLELSTCPKTGIFRSGSAITIGPSVQHKSDAKKYIEDLAKEGGLTHTEVKISSIRYKGSNNR